MTTPAIEPPRSSAIETPAPREAIEPRSDRPRFGTYRGTVDRLDLSALRRTRLDRIVREKRWVYATIVRAPWVISVVVVDLGYAQTTFGFAHHADRGLVADVRSMPGLPRVSRVRQDAIHRIDAKLRGPGARTTIRERRGERALSVHASLPGLEVRASLDLATAAPALTAIAPVRGGVVDVTEKQALAHVTGAALVGGERIDLDGGLGGFDFTVGLLARETRWNWAFLMGRTESGEAIAMNLVEGFVGAPECAVFDQRGLHALSEGRFDLPAGATPEEGPSERARRVMPWRVRTTGGEVDLVFTPRAVHDEALDLRLVQSRFVQPIGTFTGTIRRGTETLRVTDVPGVVEDQYCRW